MAGTTPRWGLTTLGPGDSISDNGFKFADGDRQLIDRLLQYAAEQHRHTGATGADYSPQLALSLSASPVGGALPSAARYYYCFTLIDEYDFETSPSPAAFAETARSLDSPAAPTASYVSGSGSLAPGVYSYVLSAYTTANTLETKAVNSGGLLVAGSNPSNEISLILPALPVGASGFNIYRKRPNALQYLYLTSIASPSPLQVFTDDGSLDEDCNRTLPADNKTSNTNSIAISLPGATPVVPAGLTWRVYRSTDPNNWERSYLADLVPVEGVTPVSYVDVGSSTGQGSPPERTQVFNAPPKVDINTETTGMLPPGRLSVPTVVKLSQAQIPPVVVTVGTGVFRWICEYDLVDLISCRAYLSPESAPAATPIIVDVHAYRPSQDATPTFTTIYTNQANRPTIAVGSSVGDAAVPDVTRLAAGDELRIDVDQAGGAATPTDYGLTMNLFMYVKSGSTTSTAPW